RALTSRSRGVSRTWVISVSPARWYSVVPLRLGLDGTARPGIDSSDMRGGLGGAMTLLVSTSGGLILIDVLAGDLDGLTRRVAGCGAQRYAGLGCLTVQMPPT